MVTAKSTTILRAWGMTLLMLCVLGSAWTRPAYAEQGELTITQKHNAGATYDAYLVFLADIAQDDTASNISWPNDETKQAVLVFLDENGYQSWLDGKAGGPEQHDLAQNAAEYVALMITGSEENVGVAKTPGSPEGSSFAQALARALARQGIEPTGNVSSDAVFKGEQGLWLFVTNSSSLDARNEAGTRPLWVPLGGSAAQVNEKSAIPSLTLEVREDSTGTWGKVADSNRGQDLPYRVTGTLPADFASYTTYHYRIDVAFPDGIELNLPKGQDLSQALSVKLGDRKATIDGKELSATYENGHLIVDFADLRSDHWEEFGIDSDTPIVVEYLAHLNNAAVIGVPGNACTAQLTYTCDSVSDAEAQSELAEVATLTYRMSLIKVDAQTKDQLKGASFSVQVAQENADAASRGLYVQEDGSLGTPIHLFTTGESGMLGISCLDEGTYLVSEVTAPTGYQLLQEPITLVIESELSDADRTLKSLKAVASSKATTSVDVLSDKGILTLTVENAKGPSEVTEGPRKALAQTGVGPLAAMLLAAGLGVLVISLPRRRS